MAKLNQIIAVVSGKKTRVQALLTETHRGWNKDAINGIVKRYTPKDENGDRLPPENKNIHIDVTGKVNAVMKQLTDFWDAVITQEMGNTTAFGTLMDSTGNMIVNTSLPVTALLFLEKQVTDLMTFITNLPTLPTDRTWVYDAARNCYVTAPVETVRTQKVPEVIVKYPATDNHPAQTELFAKDVTVGTWETTYLSSAIPEQKKIAMLNRAVALSEAIKKAREAANSIEVEQVKVGRQIAEYVFGDMLEPLF